MVKQMLESGQGSMRLLRTLSVKLLQRKSEKIKRRKRVHVHKSKGQREKIPGRSICLGSHSFYKHLQLLMTRAVSGDLLSTHYVPLVSAASGINLMTSHKVPRQVQKFSFREDWNTRRANSPVRWVKEQGLGLANLALEPTASALCWSLLWGTEVCNSSATLCCTQPCPLRRQWVHCRKPGSTNVRWRKRGQGWDDVKVGQEPSGAHWLSRSREIPKFVLKMSL